MPRGQNKDYMQVFRFHAEAQLPGGDDPMEFSFEGDAPSEDVMAEGGFSSVPIPEYSLESAEYRNGLSVFTTKQPGYPEVDELTFERGVIKNDTAMMQWILRYLDGQEFRTNISIFHWDQANAPRTGGRFDKSKARLYTLVNAFPTGFKPSGDLDAESTDIAIQELTINFEKFDLAVNQNRVTAP